MNFRVVRTSDGLVIAQSVIIADTFFRRLLGLMFKTQLPQGGGLIISPCTSIHMMFMRFPIDAVFLDRDDIVVACYQNLKPWWGFSGWHRTAEKVLELNSGIIARSGIICGDKLVLETS